MSESLPEHLDPWRAAKSGLSFSGRLAISRFPRVVGAAVGSEEDQDPQVEYRLDFGRDASGQVLVSGEIRARIRLVCQRCLGSLLVDVEASPRVALVRTEHAASELLGEYEVLVVEEDSMRPLDLIEDELLLAIPIVPRHAPGACRPPETSVDDASPSAAAAGGPAESEVEEGARHPFAVLAALKREPDTLN